MEGINHEAIGLAGHLGLGNLIVLWDDNRITIDGNTDLSTSEDVPARYRATGWHTESCDGHDFADIRRAISSALADGRPSLIACRTLIGKGSPNKQGTSGVHGSALGADEVVATRAELGWTAAPLKSPRTFWKAGVRFAHAALPIMQHGLRVLLQVHRLQNLLRRCRATFSQRPLCRSI
jgi:transketolase